MPTHDGEESLYGHAQMITIINSVLRKVGAPQTSWDRQVLQEMQELKAVIESLRQELRTTAASDITRDHVPGATDELDAVVTLTEEATNRIMNGCDQIQNDIAGLPENKQAQLQEHLIGIFEACTFQDISGQRIAKVIAALKKIDDKTHHMMNVIQTHFPETATQAPPDIRTGDEALLNGPQLPGQGISQDDIDRLLREMGQSESDAYAGMKTL